jgi:hypothetical protein
MNLVWTDLDIKKNTQILPDLVVKSQITDIIDIILQLIRYADGVHRACRNRKSRGELLSPSKGQWSTTKSDGVCYFPLYSWSMTSCDHGRRGEPTHAERGISPSRQPRGPSERRAPPPARRGRPPRPDRHQRPTPTAQHARRGPAPPPAAAGTPPAPRAGAGKPLGGVVVGNRSWGYAAPAHSAHTALLTRQPLCDRDKLTMQQEMVA